MDAKRTVMKIEEKIIKNFYRVNQKTHIILSPDACSSCIPKTCLRICPAGLYSMNESGEIMVEYSGCLECGSCFLSCPSKSIKWEYPIGGFGIQYRYG